MTKPLCPVCQHRVITWCDLFNCVYKACCNNQNCPQNEDAEGETEAKAVEALIKRARKGK